MLAIVDGVVLAANEASISIQDPGLLRGDGVFEVVRLYSGKPWALEEHLERMSLSAERLRVQFSMSAFLDEITMLLRAGNPSDAFLRLIQTRGGRRISLLEAVEANPASVALATVEYAPPPLMAGIKSLSYASNMLAVRIAVERGADDALFVTRDGRVLEASRASFFYVLDATLFTPPLDEHILDSITRRHLLRLIEVSERETMLSDLVQITEAFIASTTKEILPVRSIDHWRMPLVCGPATRSAKRSLMTAIDAATRPTG